MLVLSCLHTQVRDCLQLAWVDDDEPSKGVAYMYLNEVDHARLGSSVRSELLVAPDGERRWVIKDIIGAEDGLGVENLSGSAAIGSLFCRCCTLTDSRACLSAPVWLPCMQIP